MSNINPLHKFSQYSDSSRKNESNDRDMRFTFAELNMWPLNVSFSPKDLNQGNIFIQYVILGAHQEEFKDERVASAIIFYIKR